MHFQSFYLKNFLYFSSHFWFVERELLKQKLKRKNVSYTFPYAEVRFSKLKYFLMTIIKQFFSLYNIFF